MPTRPEKSISLYRPDQARAYNRATEDLKNRGKVDDGTSEGDKVAILSQEYLNKTKSDETKGRTYETGGYDDLIDKVMYKAFPVLLVALILSIFATVGFAAIDLLA